jgi:hypothetical protein
MRIIYSLPDGTDRQIMPTLEGVCQFFYVKKFVLFDFSATHATNQGYFPSAIAAHHRFAKNVFPSKKPHFFSRSR